MIVRSTAAANSNAASVALGFFFLVLTSASTAKPFERRECGGSSGSHRPHVARCF
jgi:hypothetical protein